MVHYPVNDKAPVSCDCLFGHIIDKFSSQKLLFLDNSVENSHPNHEAIDCDYTVEADEAQKPLVIVKANTLIDPNAVMIELLNAHIAHATVFGPRWFLYITCAALLFVCEDYPVEFVASQSLVEGLLSYGPRVDVAS
jgi:hypothetical protein